MGRKPSIDLEKAAPLITRMFWRDGYDGVTLDQIASALDVTKPTLFRTFGDKEQLFAQAVEWYYAELIKPGEDRLQASTTLRGAVAACLRTAATRMADELNPPGCLLNDSALSGDFTQGPIADVIARLQQRSVVLLTDRIATARSSGEIRLDADPDAVLQYTLSQISALSAVSRLPGHRPQLDAVVDMMMAGLPWKETKKL